MDDSTANLCQRIQETCHQQHWYEPDMYLPAQLQRELSEGGTIFWYDRHGQQYPINHRTATDRLPATWAFEYALMTEEQLQAVEQTLGFSLPPLFAWTPYRKLCKGLLFKAER